MGESLFFRAEWPEHTCPACGVTNREGWVEVASDGRVVWRGCVACWGTMQRDLPTMVELQQDNQRLMARLQQVEAEAAAMRKALAKAQDFHANLPLHTEDHIHPFTQTASEDVYTCATAALTTTAGTDLLERLRVATEALEAVERCERERQSRANRVRADIPPDRALHNESVAKCTAALRRLKGE